MSSLVPPHRPALAPAAGGRRGVVLLFVVVLLTLLAVVASSFLISTRVTAGQMTPESRGALAEPVDLAELRVAEVRDAATQAVQTQLFLDLFETQRELTDSGDPAPSAARNFPTNLFFRAAPVTAQNAGALSSTTVLRTQDEYAVPQIRTETFTEVLATDLGPVRFPYHDIDALGPTDPHLASARVTLDPPTAGGAQDDERYYWEWISAPLIGLPGLPVDHRYANPFGGSLPDLSNLDPSFEPLTQRSRLTPTVLDPKTQPGLDAAGGFNDSRVRVYPALFRDTNGNDNLDTGEFVMPAADADGDGVADSGMVAIVFDNEVAAPNAARYLDPETQLVYTYSVRIVDNNAAVNLNTALQSLGDLSLHTTGAGVGGGDLRPAQVLYETAFNAPNRGIWPSNIGAYELFPIHPGNTTPAIAQNFGGINEAEGEPRAYRQEQFQSLLTSMLDLPTIPDDDNAVDRFNKIPPLQTGEAVEAELGSSDGLAMATYGEFMGLTLATRLANPPVVAVRDDQVPVAMQPLTEAADIAQLLYRGGGWLPERLPASRADLAMEPTLLVGAGNYTAGDVRFGPFPLRDPSGDRDLRYARLALWARMFQTADPTRTSYAFNRNSLGIGTVTGGSDFPISPRVGLVAENGSSQAFSPLLLLPSSDINDADQVPQGMPAYGKDGATELGLAPVRAGLNAAGFGELYRAFWNVMASKTGGPVAANDFPTPIEAGTPEPAFTPDTARTALPAMSEEQLVLLRSAIAAVNTMDLRDIETTDEDGDNTSDGLRHNGVSDVTAAAVDLGTFFRGTGTADLKARVYGSEAQPFIAEVVVEWEVGGVAVDYAAVELINPYPFPIEMSGWQLVSMSPNGGPMTVLMDFDAVDAGNPFYFPAGNTTNDANTEDVTDDVTAGTPDGYRVVVEAGVSTALPQTTALDDQTSLVVNATGTPGDFVGDAIVLVRPARAINGPRAVAGDIATLQEDWNLVPLDMVDFGGALDDDLTSVSGLSADQLLTRRARYARSDDERSWKVAVHGEWDDANADASELNNTPGNTNNAGTASLGVRVYQEGATVGEAVPSLGEANIGGVASVSVPTFDPGFGFPTGPVLAGPVSSTNATDVNGNRAPTFPYGGFARDGDVMNVPFVGCYVLYVGASNLASTAEIRAIRPMTVDLDHAGINDTTITNAAQLAASGRFIPFLNNGGTRVDVHPWAEDVIEHFTAYGNYGSDTFPNVDLRYLGVDPTLAAAGTGSLPTALQTNLGTGPNRLFASMAAPVLVDNDNEGIDSTTLSAVELAAEEAYAEAFLPVQGRLNPLTGGDLGTIKTLPLVVDANGLQDGPTTDGFVQSLDFSFSPTRGSGLDTDNLAGPFVLGIGGGISPIVGVASFADLLEQGNTTLNPSSRGDLSGLTDDGYSAGAVDLDGEYYDLPDNVAEDPERAIVDVARISNLTTTRSDHYTVYLLVQAWRDWGGNNARPVRQQRIAFTVDRSGVLPPNHGYSTLPGASGYNSVDEALDALKVRPVPAFNR
jgi:hypothetical protein